MNAILIISIFTCGFALGLILFILLEKIFDDTVVNDDDNLNHIQEHREKSLASAPGNSQISSKQNFIDRKLGLTNRGNNGDDISAINNLKTKIIELKKGKKITL